MRFGYKAAVRTVDPYALGMWRNRWYVVGRDHDADALRKFRLDRIDVVDGEDPVVTVGAPGAFTVPDGFEAETELRLDPNAWGTDEPLVAHVRVDHDHAPQLLGEFAGAVEHDDADGTVVTHRGARPRVVPHPAARIRHRRVAARPARARGEAARLARVAGGGGLMPPKAAGEQFRVIAGALALAEERESVSLTEVAATLGVGRDELIKILTPVVLLEFRDSTGEVIAQIDAFDLDVDTDMLHVRAGHWLRDWDASRSVARRRAAAVRDRDRVPGDRRRLGRPRRRAGQAPPARRDRPGRADQPARRLRRPPSRRSSRRGRCGSGTRSTRTTSRPTARSSPTTSTASGGTGSSPVPRSATRR